MEDAAENQTPVKRPLPLPVGNSDWAAVKGGYWSADKTQLIAGLLDRKATVALFTRPRRFGKTFAINMLQTFFEKTAESNAHLFEGTKVWADPAHRAEQGKYPVISITFKDAKGSNWGETRAFLERAVASRSVSPCRRHNTFSRCSGLQDSCGWRHRMSRLPRKRWPGCSSSRNSQDNRCTQRRHIRRNCRQARCPSPCNYTCRRRSRGACRSMWRSC